MSAPAAPPPLPPAVPPDRDAAIFALARPHRDLFTYYCVSLLAVFPLLPVLILPAWFRYHTLRYRFTTEGISMSWGILFRREIIVNYARIQDIHLRSNVVERWLGLGRVLVQTASGNAGAELTLEGLKEFEAIRDFLYHRMRGVKDYPRSDTGSAPPSPAAAPSGSPSAGPAASVTDAELAATLNEVAAELRALRLALAARPPAAPSSAAPSTPPADV